MTSPYNVRFSPSACRHLLALTPKQQRLIIRLMETLAVNPRPPGAKKIEGLTGLYAEEIDHVRLLYKIEDQEILLLLIK